jgi:hypothetical protein
MSFIGSTSWSYAFLVRASRERLARPPDPALGQDRRDDSLLTENIASLDDACISFFTFIAFIRGCGCSMRVSRFVRCPQGLLAMNVPTFENLINQQVGGIDRSPANDQCTNRVHAIRAHA